MNVYKPLMIAVSCSPLHPVDGCTNFVSIWSRALAQPQEIADYVERSLMLVTALSPVIGYDKASAIAHKAMRRI